MNYIVFDLEFNQDFSSLQVSNINGTSFPFEIIQIGAVKLDSNFKTVATFNRYVKPTIYTNVNSFITELTGITTEQLQTEEHFPMVYQDYLEFIGETDAIFCIWGMADIKEIYKNAQYHQLNRSELPNMYINLQSYTSLHFELPPKKLLRLKTAVEALNIPITVPFHNALADAYYTAELFKKIYHSSFELTQYDPTYVITTPRQPKREVDYDQLLHQFIKMYNRELTEEEQNIIKLAYKMGRTNQFLK